MPDTVELERVVENGRLVTLGQRGPDYEVAVDGRRTMASDVRRAERSLVELALAPLKGRDDISVLLAGLGMGFALRAILDAPGVKRVDVVEISPAVIDWDARYFGALNGQAARDPRVTVHVGEFSLFLKGRLARGDRSGEWLALILDVDEGPGGLDLPGNAGLYTEAGLHGLEAAVRPGGVVALWSSVRETELMRRMHGRLQNVAEVAVPVEANPAGLDYVYRGRRIAPPAPPDKLN
jgi:spermidine synthase